MLPYLALAFVSGAPALVYQVVWTRQVALAAGSQVEAISAVLVVFFGGLALGSRWLSPLADRTTSPLRLYGALEVSAGCLALAASALLHRLAAAPLGSGAGSLFVAAAIPLPVTFLLGGTLPALLRGAARDPEGAARAAGWLAGLNTAGAVAGVCAAVLWIPSLGLRACAGAAGATGIALGAVALALPVAASAPRATASAILAPRAAALAIAVLAGTVTLAFEVLTARAAALRLGSSLYGWGLVLGLFLAGLAGGNALGAELARRARRPLRDLGLLEAAAAALVAWGASWGVPSLDAPATGPSAAALLELALWLLPPTALMGAAFPLFVRLGLRDAARVGGDFGAVAAANTAGGIAGALLAPFALLPALGLTGSILACAALSAALGAILLASSGTGPARLAGAAAALGLAAVAAWPALTRAPSAGPERVLFAHHGPQASAAVLHSGGRRTLVVDGDPEASTAGNARRTEELLALIPLLLHPRAERFLEVGLGAGITLGTAERVGAGEVECVEIAEAVLRATPFFAPDNGAVAAGDGRIRVVRADGRTWLAHHPGRYDVVVANTVHPWSVGATGLYSREYYARVARALRPGGLAAQWLPVERIGSEALAALLRTFYAVFEHGGLWWGAESLVAVGSAAPFAPDAATDAPAPARVLADVGWRSAADLGRRRVASAAAVREAVGPGEILSDDRPALEALAARQRGSGGSGGELALVARIARAGASPQSAALSLWLAARAAQAEGDTERAEQLERLAERGGLPLAAEARSQRRVAEATSHLASGQSSAAERALREALAIRPDARDARFALAALAVESGRPEVARDELGRLLRDHPDDAEAWNLLGISELRAGDARASRRAFARALDADPFLAEALANAGLLAVRAGERAEAERLLARLRAIGPLGPTPEERALARALEEMDSG